MIARLVCYVPSDRPVGGIAKVLDYGVHAARRGVDVVFCCQNLEKKPGESALFDKPYFREHGAGIAICSAADLKPRDGDVVFFTLPSSFGTIRRLYAAAGLPPPPVIHLLQNVRVANTAFDDGFSFRLLPKPMHRICITQEVFDAVEPYVEDRDKLVVIPHGFDFHAFSRLPRREDKVVLNFNTFKGHFAKTLADEFAGHPKVAGIRSANRGISWDDLQRSYRTSTLFLATPLPEEGLYLPGLEAMAAGHLVITPDAFGNRFYCDFGENCRLVPWEDAGAYRAAIGWALDNWHTDAVFEMRSKAFATAGDLGLGGECSRFAEELQRYA